MTLAYDDIPDAIDRVNIKSGAATQGWNARYIAALIEEGFMITNKPPKDDIWSMAMPEPYPGDYPDVWWEMPSWVIVDDGR